MTAPMGMAWHCSSFWPSSEQTKRYERSCRIPIGADARAVSTPLDRGERMVHVLDIPFGW